MKISIIEKTKKDIKKFKIVQNEKIEKNEKIENEKVENEKKVFQSLQNNENIDDILHPQDSIRGINIDDYNLKKLVEKNEKNHENEKIKIMDLSKINDVLVCLYIQICMIMDTNMYVYDSHKNDRYSYKYAFTYIYIHKHMHICICLYE
jgi:hypothetical protein